VLENARGSDVGEGLLFGQLALLIVPQFVDAVNDDAGQGGLGGELMQPSLVL
jgi:hypothetical protein